ncbi:MAG: four helix bundle protein [Planctomycetia bacterium]|nr:four helix bundle protein [Planctomycetia bacterium]
MPLIRSFEDLRAWQEARALRSEIYRLSRMPSFRTDPELRSQIRRSALSAMSNIAEGFERNSPAQFSHFLGIAKASAAETRSQLYAALDDGLITRSEFEKASESARSVSRLCGGLVSSLQRRQGLPA